VCHVCAVSYEDVVAVAERIDSRPRVISLDPNTLGEVLDNVRTLAAATDRQEQGAALLEELAARVDAVREAVAGAQRPRVAALEWLEPVYVAGHWTPQLIDYAGGEDVLGRAGERSEVRSWEEVAAAEPDVVVVMPCGYDASRSHEEAGIYREQLDGVGARTIVAVDAAGNFSRPGPRLIDGLEVLGHLLHPDRVPEPAGASRAVPV
jgi:iron complex transport system substrate-binding protein